MASGKGCGMSDADISIQNSINESKSFILDAGAGSGKTYSLVEALRYLCKEKGTQLIRSGQRIACITYTNVAKDEIIRRIESNPLGSV
jgi:DNA helicase-2/ATP-dependent DNA helicase PcrA